MLLFINTCVLAMVTGSAFAISVGLSTFCQFAMKSLIDLGVLQKEAYVLNLISINMHLVYI